MTQNTSIDLENIVGKLVLKVNIDFGFFPDAQSSLSPLSGEETVLNINIRLELFLGLETLINNVLISNPFTEMWGLSGFPIC